MLSSAGVRRPLLALLAALLLVGIFAGGLAWLLDTPRPPAGAGRGARLYHAYCVTCHGVDGRGSWRAALFLLRPGDLTDAGRMAGHTDAYLFDIIKRGGDPLGRPGMPAFGFLGDADIQALVEHVRRLAGAGSRASRQPLDPEQAHLVALGPDGQLDAVAGARVQGVEQRGVGGHGHQLHGLHAERRHRGVANEEQVGRGPRHHFPAHLVGPGADDRPPETHGEGGEQAGEEAGEDPAGAAGAYLGSTSAGCRFSAEGVRYAVSGRRSLPVTSHGPRQPSSMTRAEAR